MSFKKGDRVFVSPEGDERPWTGIGTVLEHTRDGVRIELDPGDSHGSSRCFRNLSSLRLLDPLELLAETK